MGGAKRQQLQMVIPEARIAGVSVPPAPARYTLRTYAPKDAASYLDLMHLAGFTGWGPENLDNALGKVLPDGLFVVEHESGVLAATAMATHSPAPLHPFGGELGWVAGHPEHSGRGLGLIVCAAVVRRYEDAGYRRVFLRTDDFRLAAIKVYLKLGFEPFLFAPDMRERWEAVCEKLSWPFTPDDWPNAEQQTAPPTESDERPNADRIERYRPRKKWLPGRPHRAYSGGGDMDAFSDESLYMPSMLGSARAEPAEVSAGAVLPLKLTYTVGKAGVPAGTIISFAMRGQNPLGILPESPAIVGPKGCVLKQQGRGLVLEDGCLTEGQEVSLQWEPFAWTPLAGRREFKVTFTYPNGQSEQRLPEPLAINVLPLEADRLDITLPGTHTRGEAVRGRVTVRDRFDNRVPTGGTVRISGGGTDQDVTVVSGAGDFVVGGSEGEAVRVTGACKSAAVMGESNPSVASDDLHLYIGDLHAHDFLSEAEGYTDEVYRWAMEERRLDFLSVVPQSHGWHDNETWTVTKYMNERFLREGEFVTFLGFEWQHTGYGDKVIHFLGGDQPFLPVEDPRYSSPAKLYKALQDSDMFVISHHPAYPPGNWCPATDFDAVDTAIERVVELWSMHGSSEGYDLCDRPLRRFDARHTVYEALRRGLRLGFVAGSDSHSARPGGSAKEPLGHWGGLAAVWAKDLTRRSVFEAVRARRTYALTRARIVARMTVNGAWMGSELPASDTAQIRIEACAPASIARVEIMKNTRVLREFGLFGDRCTIEFEDTTGGPAFYHCRITQIDGELAVCSPVWIG